MYGIRSTLHVFRSCCISQSVQWRFASSVDKSALNKLRKKTGFAFIKCKEALLKFENNTDEAEKWLRAEAQKQGWAKATKLQSRPMSQGLLTLVTEGSTGAMLELNCETDFVARNEKFQQLAADCTAAFISHAQQHSSSKLLLEGEELGQVPASSGQALADLVATQVGQLGENMRARRAVLLKATGSGTLGHYIHAAGPEFRSVDSCRFGKYAALVSYRRTHGHSSEVGVAEVGRQLCQHIVGMNPERVGVVDEDERASDSDDEPCLVHQPFLLEPDVTCGDFLRSTGTHITDFVRFECGEEEQKAEE